MAAKKATAKAAGTGAKRPAKKKAKAEPVADVIVSTPRRAGKTEGEEAAAAAQPLKAAGGGRQSQGSAIVSSARALLAKDGPFVPYKDGYWGKPKARLDHEGHPVVHIKAFVLQILVDKGHAEFSKFKPVKGGKRAVEVRAVGGK